MRLSHRALWIACIALAALWPLPPACGQKQDPVRPKPDAAATEDDAEAVPDAAAKADGKDTPLTMKDIERRRGQGMSPAQIADDVAERGRGFEVTADITQDLRGLGFRPAQISAIKESSAEPLVPGKGLTTSEERRDEIFEEMEDVAEASKTGIRPIQSRHATLWAAKAARQTYLPDLQKLERFFHTRCAEPIRCGLDKRSTHVILLKDHAEYEAWWRAMFKKRPADFPDAGGAELRDAILKQRESWWGGFA